MVKYYRVFLRIEYGTHLYIVTEKSQFIRKIQPGSYRFHEGNPEDNVILNHLPIKNIQAFRRLFFAF